MTNPSFKNMKKINKEKDKIGDIVTDEKYIKDR